MKNPTKNWKRTAVSGLIMASMGIGMLTGCAANAEGSAASPSASAAGATDTDGTREVTEEDLGTASVGRSDTDGKEETVYIFAGADGTEKSMIVDNWLKNGSGKDTIIDKTELTDIENVKGDETYTQGSDGTITWAAGGNDIYYQGSTTKTAPVSVQVTYKLDGKTIQPEDLAGKSGKVTIHFDYTNSATENVEENGKQYTVKVPFGMVTGVVLPEDTFSGISAVNGKIVSDGSNTIVVGTAFPGLKESLNWQNLVNQTTDADAKKKLTDFNIPEYFEITADAKDFKLTSTMTVASSEIFSEIDLSDSIDTNELTSKISDLQDATEQLISGAKELKTGTVQLRSGTSDLVSGTGTLVSGASELKTGAQKVADGAGQVSDGASQLSTGLGKLSASSSALNAGAQDIADGVMKSANSTLIEKGLIDKSDPLTWSNYPERLGVLTGVTEAMRKEALADIKAALVKGGMTSDDANTYAQALIYMASANAKTTISSEADLTKALSEQTERLKTASKTQTKVDTATKAAETTYSDGDVKNMLALIRANSGSTVYNAAAAGIKGTESSVTDAQAAAIIAYACENYAAAITDKSTLTTNINMAAAELQKAATAQSETKPLENTYVISLLAAARQGTTDSAVCQSVISSLKSQGVPDDSTAKLILAYAAYSDGNLSSAAAAVTKNNMDQTVYANAQNALKGDILQDSKVQAVLVAVRNSLSDEDVYQGLISQLQAADSTLSVTDAGTAIVYAAENYDTSKTLTENLAVAGSALKKAAAAQTAAAGGSTDADVSKVMTKVAAALSDAEIYSTLLSSIMNDGGKKDVTEADAKLLIAYTAENLSSLDGSTVSEKLQNAAAEIKAAQEVQSEISAAASDNGKAIIKGVLNSMVQTSADYTELTDLEKSLTGIASFIAGLQTYTDGVDSAYSGAQTLASGAGSLKSGADSLNSGVATLQEGIASLNTGANKLNSGAVQLDDGVSKLQSGLDEFNRKGIQKLTSLFGDNINDVLDRIHALETAGAEYNTFTGTADTENSSVKFIYKTDSIGE